jgi:pimeloyl-ACP methyl ester carboxylesterase
MRLRTASRALHRGRLLALAAAVAACLAASVSPTRSAAARADQPDAARPKPTVVLVHGAWADSSSWNGVVARLLRAGYPVDVFPTPLRSLSTDSTALRQYLDTISGPIVLVGHSYGGAVITDAATGEAHVRALVYIDAFAPAAGERVLDLPGPDSVLAAADPTAVFDLVPGKLPPRASTDLYVKKSVFPSAFANDLPPTQGRVLAATQRPVTLGALMEPSTAPAWTDIPSWYEVGTRDKVIPASAQLTMANRIGAHIRTADTGHLPMISKTTDVANTIEDAASATS